MKLNTSTHKATGAGFKEVAKFKMDMNAKAARVLSDTLYKDKIGSIIREISCNAFDAHIQAGCPEKPFKVKLPDAFDPTFSVRDFGPGLSHEDVEGIYTTYFGSTKDQANDAVGAFGLGSKTPFSYTDSFMVTSIHKGVKRVYNAYLEEGLPQISMFGEGQDTDEPDGLEVTVTIDPKDFHEFKNSLVKQLRFFPVKPEASVEWPTIEKEIAKIDGFTYFQSNNDVMRGFFIKQGPVAYPVDFDLVRDYYTTHISKTGSSKNLPYYARTPKNEGERFIQFLESFNRSYYGRSNNMHGAYMDMPIGTVEVTASREGISYTQETMHNICVALDDVRAKMFDSIKHKLDDAFASSKGEFYNLYKDLPEFMVSFLPREQFNYKYAPFHIDRNGGLTLKLPKKFKDLQVSIYSCHSTDKAKKESHYSYVESDNSTGNSDYDGSAFEVNVLNRILGNTPVYYKDENYAFAARATNDVEGSKFAIIELPEDKYDAFVKFLDGAVENITKVSTLPMPTRNTKSGGRSITGGQKRSWFWLNSSVFQNYSVTGTLYNYGCDQEFNETVEDYDGKTLVCFNTYNNKISDTGLPFEILNLVFNYATMEQGDDYACIGIAEKDMKRGLKKNPTNFVSVKDYFEANKDTIIKAVRNGIDSAIVGAYENRMRMHFNMNKLFSVLDRIKYDGEVKLVGLDDVFVSANEYDNSAGTKNKNFLGSMHPATFKDAMTYLGTNDVFVRQQDAETIMRNATSIEQVEKQLKGLNVPIVSMVENHKKIADMLREPANRKAFLNLVIEGRIGNHCKISDRFQSDAILVDPIKIAKEIVGEIA